MKKWLMLSVVALFALNLSACADLTAKMGQVKDPAAGYEVEPPMGG